MEVLSYHRQEGESKLGWRSTIDGPNRAWWVMMTPEGNHGGGWLLQTVENWKAWKAWKLAGIGLRELSPGCSSLLAVVGLASGEIPLRTGVDRGPAHGELNVNVDLIRAAAQVLWESIACSNQK